MIKIGIIGGSGLDDLDIFEDKKEIEVNTLFGKPSSSLTLGKIKGVDVVILSRHGKKHTIMPGNVNYRANIHALKELGVTHLLVSTACGSLREEIKPGDLVFPNQFIDRTTKRHSTFYDKDQVCHIPMENPFCNELRNLIVESAKDLDLRFHNDKTVITIEGPRFSTKAESKMFRNFGADIINMSTVPEVILAREVGICYQAIAMATDYDCFMETKENVSWEQIEKIMKMNSENVKRLFLGVIPKIKNLNCGCKEAIKSSLISKDSIDLSNKSIKEKIRTIPHFPKHGVMFRDITTLLKDKDGFNEVIEKFVERYKDKEIDLIAGIESRGFILAGAVAHRLGKGFVPIRKAGKLPFETEEQEYELEYGTDKIEVHKDAIKERDKVLIIDDLVATSGTCLATCKLIEKLGGEVIECGFIVELPDLKGRAKLEREGYNVFSLVQFEGE